VRGEPIVCTPEDAFRCFMGTGLDVLVAGRCIVHKDRQDPSLLLDYRSAFALD
jgi:carbamoyltransferase